MCIGREPLVLKEFVLLESEGVCICVCCAAMLAVFKREALSPSDTFFLHPTGCLHHDDSLPALLLFGIVLLGPNRGLAVLHGSDGKGSDQAHPQALSVSRLG